MLTMCASIQVRPGGLAAFPVEVAAPEDGEDADEEGLVVMVEVPKDTKPKAEDVKELVGFIRAQVSTLPSVLFCIIPERAFPQVFSNYMSAVLM